MSLSDALLLEAAKFNLWIANRADQIAGSGTAADPYNGSTVPEATLGIALSNVVQEATASTAPMPHHFEEGDIVRISGVTGADADLWNGSFGIYTVTEFSFKYFMRKEPAPSPPGNPTCSRLRLLFDRVMKDLIPANTRIQLGAGVFLTRGFSPNDSRGWQPKSGQKIVGAGVDVTALQLVGADQGDKHYHAIGMPMEPIGSDAITPLEFFEVSDLTIDSNVDNQPGRPNPGYANVACGAVRILGNRCTVRRVKAINWGTKSLKQGCFVISIIQASGQPTDGNSEPVITEKADNGIEDCIAVLPSKNNARECTVLHIGGLKNSTNHAQGFGRIPFIRRNYVDCQFFATAKFTSLLTSVSPVRSSPRKPARRLPVLEGSSVSGHIFVNRR